MKNIKLCFLVILLIISTCSSFIFSEETPGRIFPNVAYTGVRSSRYGLEPFPEPAEWEKATKIMVSHFDNAKPSIIWVIGRLKNEKFCWLEFPVKNKKYPNIISSKQDNNERYFDYFDEKGITVFLMVEPANANVLTLIDLILKKYKHHNCIAGLGIDVEWYKELNFPIFGKKVDDETAKLWEKKVKSYNPKYKLLLKHWNREWMPQKYRGNIIFVDDSQNLPSLEKMIKEFKNYWADFFKPNPVFFQIGYDSDSHWWDKLDSPPKDIGSYLAEQISNECGIFWVDFTLKRIWNNK